MPKEKTTNALTICVEYLTGVCFAARHDDRSRPEWPPHPDRLYSALVAAAAEPMDGDGVDPSAATTIPKREQDALQWLAGLGPPRLHASDARERLSVDVFMPTNPHEDEVWSRTDGGGKSKGKNKKASTSPSGWLTYTPKANFDLRALLPIHRKKAGLPIPAVIPQHPAVKFVWPTVRPEDAEPHLSTLRGIAARVGYLGRSRSLVLVSVECGDEPAFTTTDSPRIFVPDRHGDRQLRIPGPNRLAYLLDHYEKGGRSGKPDPSPPCRFRVHDDGANADGPLNTVFDRLWILRPQPDAAPPPPTLPIEATVMLTRRFRAALLECCDNADATTKSFISGHDEMRKPLNSPHPAVLALPFVHPAQRHADGSIKGVAIAFPRGTSDAVLDEVAGGLGRIRENGLSLTGIGVWRLEEVFADAPPIRTLDAQTWLGPRGGSRAWTSVIPMVFGRYPKPNRGGEVGEVLESLRLVSHAQSGHGSLTDHVVEIAIDRHSPLHGAAPSWHFKAARDRGGKNPTQPPARHIRHVTLRFDRPVRGPLLLGAMRYFGMGLMRPMEHDHG
jgi:CRISPR-associated protein Csb2